MFCKKNNNIKNMYYLIVKIKINHDQKIYTLIFETISKKYFKGFSSFVYCNFIAMIFERSFREYLFLSSSSKIQLFSITDDNSLPPTFKEH